jgi:hypothetical protein
VKVLRAALLTLVLGLPSWADEPVLVDQAALNARIGLDYQDVVTWDELVEEALMHRLILYGEVHDQKRPARQLQRLVLDLRERSEIPVRIGVEFVDREDSDVMRAYLDGRLDEASFLERLFPTSLLLSPQVGGAHLEILRFARQQGIEVIALESRPAGSRPRTLRHSEIRWNLARRLGQHPDERLVVLYGVDHILGDAPSTDGLSVDPLVITSYADSVQAAFLARHARYPRPGEVLRLRSGVFLDAGDVPRRRSLLHMGFDTHDELLGAIEATYWGDRTGIPLLVQALGDDQVRWRRAAHLALRFAFGENLGYDPDAEPLQRREAQARWRTLAEREPSTSSAAP